MMSVPGGRKDATGKDEARAPPDMDYTRTNRTGPILAALALSQAVSSAAVAINFMSGSILLVQMSGGNRNLAGAPGALTLLVSSAAAIYIGRLKDRIGYRSILKLGYASGIGAGVLAAVAASYKSMPLLLCAMVLVGLATGSIMLCRFAAAEIHPAETRGKALSKVMMGATVGALCGPLLVDFAYSLGRFLPSGPVAAFSIVAVLYLAGLASVGLLVRVEPKDLAVRETAPDPAGAQGGEGSAPARGVISDRAFALGSLSIAQVAMVFVMAVTPVHMHHHHHAMGEISFVLMAHFFGMYGCSFLTGAFADRYGRAAAIGTGSAVLLASCLLGALAQGYAGLLAALFLLGLGWNFCFLSGTALVADSLKGVADKGRIQGRADAFVSVGSAVAGFSSGFCLELIGFRGMAFTGCVLSVLPMLLLLLRHPPSRRGT